MSSSHETFVKEKKKIAGLGGGGRGVHSVCVWPQSYDHRSSHPDYSGTEHVGFSPTRQALLLAPSAKRREAVGESPEG